ncbi:MAG: SUF system NifU family Fe-S cluster assembly protein [candidate division Zixibacteria bacterium]|nr:SUF system NifU family Fe-S cluster assembly protein [candidate division Zixibacteria bacterium]MBU1471124.1 SUF system NifU family Fe-S cluster assembly protein [candidate division Zixibacteria bacterium]MBU2625645.1 SUF system NifU family Fe-S cluster assembly protein [candidate division Zixibacteria bacterium]
MNDALDSLYREVVLDHYKNPRGKKKLDHVDFKNEGKNPMCGDEIEVELEVDGNRVKNLSVSCAGCAISVASGSMLYEVIKGKSLPEVKKIAQIVKAMLKGEEHSTDGIDLGDLEVLEGVRKFPVRIKCALLSWTTLIDTLDGMEKGRTSKLSSTE